MILWFYKHTKWNNVISGITTPDLDLGTIGTPYGHNYNRNDKIKISTSLKEGVLRRFSHVVEVHEVLFSYYKEWLNWNNCYFII